MEPTSFAIDAGDNLTRIITDIVRINGPLEGGKYRVCICAIFDGDAAAIRFRITRNGAMQCMGIKEMNIKLEHSDHYDRNIVNLLLREEVASRFSGINGKIALSVLTLTKIKELFNKFQWVIHFEDGWQYPDNKEFRAINLHKLIRNERDKIVIGIHKFNDGYAIVVVVLRMVARRLDLESVQHFISSLYAIVEDFFLDYM